MQFATDVRNARADAVETTIGTSAIMKVRTGAAPATCASADAGTVLATLSLPSDWLAAAASGVKSKSGTWQDLAADAAGTAAHFRIYDSGGTTCKIQGTVTITSGGGDMEVDDVDFEAGQEFNVTAFAWTEGNA